MSENGLNEKADSLPFSDKAQAAFMGYIIKEEQLLRQAKDLIVADWFLDSKMGDLFTTYVKFYKEFSRPPRKEEFFDWDVVSCKDFSKKLELKKNWSIAEIETNGFGRDFIAQQLTAWLRSKIWVEATRRAVDFFNASKLTESSDVMRQAIKAYEDANFEIVPQFSFENPLDLVLAQEGEYGDALTTGLTVLDKKLNPDCSKGSLLRGDTTVILAPVNVGKSTTLITIARHNIKDRKDVLYITHEGRARDIMEKLFCSLTRCTRSAFRAAAKDPNNANAGVVERAGRALHQKLTYLSMNKPGLTVEEVLAAMSAAQDKRKSVTGKGYDLVIVDYPGILKSSSTGKNGEHRHEQDTIYRQFVQFALDQNVHMMLAAQTNRAASKQNRNSSSHRARQNDESKLLTHDDVAESWGIAQSATNVITLNRDAVSMAKGYLTLYISKSRSSETDWAIMCKSDFSVGLAFSDELGATAYKGSQTMSENIESLTQQYKNSEIDQMSMVAIGK